VDLIDIDNELNRWRSTGLPTGTQRSALVNLREKVEYAREEQKEAVDALTQELAYSLCWPEGIGEDTLVSKAYRLLGPVAFPIPDDPDPIRLSLKAQQERLQSLNELISEIDALLARLDS
jgi:hypothetical protein